MNIVRMRTPFEQAAPAGKKILAQAVEAHKKRQEDGKTASYQAAKEAATYLVHKRNGRVMVRFDFSECSMDYNKVFGHS